jgi:hypothetical protein
VPRGRILGHLSKKNQRHLAGFRLAAGKGNIEIETAYSFRHEKKG